MRIALSVFVALVLLIPAPGSGRSASAEDEILPNGLTKAESKALQGKLRSRASSWWRKRKKLSARCAQCEGTGQVRWKRGRMWTRVTCPKCDGNKMHVDRDTYRYCFYDMRSPAFRLQEAIRARITQAYLKAKRGEPFPVVLKRYIIRTVEIVDATHGIVYVEENGDSVARPQRWIRAAGAGEKPDWYFYDTVADGVWPSEKPEPEPVLPDEPIPMRPPPGAEPPDEPEDEPPPEPVPVEPVAPEPPPPPPEPSVLRVGFSDSQALIATWTEERNNMRARVIRIRLGLDDVEGHEQTVADVRTFLVEVDGWLEEEKAPYTRAVEDVEKKERGVRLEDRLKINTLHFKAHRRLTLVEKMLIGVVPGLRD